MRRKTKILLLVIIVTMMTFNVVGMSSNNVSAATSFTEDHLPDVTIRSTAEIDLNANADTLARGIDLSWFIPTESVLALRKTDTGLRATVNTDILLTQNSEVNDNSIQPSVDKIDDVSSWQVERFLDASTPHIENTTDQTDAYEIANNFNSATYQYLAIGRARSNSTSATTIKISYSDALTGNISSSADTTNTTICNKLIPTIQFLIYRLDLEATNASRPYIIHIEFDELICDFIKIFDCPDAQNYKDERYATFYMGASSTAVNVSALGVTNEWEEILAHGSDYTKNWRDNVVRGVGFKSADTFEDKLMESWVAVLNNEIGAYLKSFGIKSVTVGDIDDYSITDLLLNAQLAAETSKLIFDECTCSVAENSAVETYLTETKDRTIRSFTVTSSISPDVLSENDDAEGITDLSNAIIAAADKSKGSAITLGTDILDAVTSTLGKINEPLGAFFSSVRESAAAIVGGDNWLLLIIIGSSVVGTGLVIGITWFVISKKK